MRYLTLLLAATIGVAGLVVCYANEAETVKQKVSEDEIAGLEQWVARATATHKMIVELRAGGSSGGELQNELLTRYQMLIAKAQLASSKGQPDKCERLWTAAVSAADECVKATEAAYRSGLVDLDRLVRSQEQHANARVELSRIEQQKRL